MTCNDPVHAREIIEDCIAIGLCIEIGPGDELFLSGRGDPIAVQVVHQHYEAVTDLLKSDPLLARRAREGKNARPPGFDHDLARAQMRDFFRGVFGAAMGTPYASGEAATPKPETPPLTQDQRRRVYQAIAQPLPEDLR